MPNVNSIFQNSLRDLEQALKRKPEPDASEKTQADFQRDIYEATEIFLKSRKARRQKPSKEDLHAAVEKFGVLLKSAETLGLALVCPYDAERNGHDTKYTFLYRTSEEVADMLAYLIAVFTKRENIAPSHFIAAISMLVATMPDFEHCRNDEVLKALLDFVENFTADGENGIVH